MAYKVKHEYVTDDSEEQLYLKSRGIKYLRVDVVNDVTLWRYKKNPKLFEALKCFYINNQFFD